MSRSTSTTTMFIDNEDVPQVAVTVVVPAVSIGTAVGLLTFHVGLPLGHAPEGFGAAVTGIVASGLPLAT
jgi:hypothetical protein